MPACQEANGRWASILLSLMICLLWTAAAVGQELDRPGFRFYRNEQGEIDGVGISGTRRLHTAGLDALPKLVYFKAWYGSKLTAEDVTYLSKLTSLQELIIGQEPIDPPVVIEGDLRQLSNLKSLRTLHFCKHDIRDNDLQFVAALSELTSIELNACGESDDKQFQLTDRCAEYLSAATKLRRIYFQNSGDFSDRFVEQIAAKCSELECLNLSSSKLTDASLASLAVHCRKLTSLDVYSTGFTANALTHLAQLEKLENLWLGGLLPPSTRVEEIAGLQALKHLGLRIHEISDAGMRGIASMRNLEVLALQDTSISDEQFALLRGHSKLRSILMDGQKLTEEELSRTIESIPNLKYISLGKDCANLEKAVSEKLKQRATGTADGQPQP